MMDGTFRRIPTIYGQFYTIVAQVGGFVVPLVYGLLRDKTAETYRTVLYRLLGYVAVIGVQLQPTTIITDCEAAVIIAVRDVLPSTKHRLCYFHFC